MDTLFARAAAESAGFDRIALIPTGQPPHKQGDSNIITAAHRLEMARLAVADDPLFVVDDIELKRTGPSYTIDTVRLLRGSGWSEIAWLIGADMAIYLPHWHAAVQLLAEVHFVLMARPGWSFDWAVMPPEYRHLEAHVVQTPLIDISSTEIRRRIAAGRSVEYMTPPRVIEYIERSGLYRSAKAKMEAVTGER